MGSIPLETVDLLDLKMLPAWVKESPETGKYSHYSGDEGGQGQGGPERPRDARRERRKNRSPRRRDRAGPRRQQSSPIKEGEAPGRRGADVRKSLPGDRASRDRHHPRHHQVAHDENRQKAADAITKQVAVHFLPHSRVLQNVIEQIKSNTVAYSIFSLARLFLEKPERYDVRLTPNAGFSLYRLGENGAVSADRQFLENNAFRLAEGNFYRRETKQLEPIRGNFSGVARCRLSGVVLGPTNYHGYQPKLRSLYEQRFSRRMTFPEYQRQIEIINDPALIEHWKEEARSVVTFSTLHEENPSTFATTGEAERHFRHNYLPGLVQEAGETVFDGLTSRQMPDRVLRRLIENTWSREIRSPSQMMQELARNFREAGLHIFRHRRGMLFISPIRVRPFPHDQSGVSPQVKAILETLAQSPRASRKELADKIFSGVPNEEVESRKLALASDLHWLISEGYVIEFNDGTLDLPRTKAAGPKSGDERTSGRVEESRHTEGPNPAAAASLPEPTGPSPNKADADGETVVEPHEEAIEPITVAKSDESPLPG